MYVFGLDATQGTVLPSFVVTVIHIISAKFLIPPLRPCNKKKLVATGAVLPLPTCPSNFAITLSELGMDQTRKQFYPNCKLMQRIYKCCSHQLTVLDLQLHQNSLGFPNLFIFRTFCELSVSKWFGWLLTRGIDVPRLPHAHSITLFTLACHAAQRQFLNPPSIPAHPSATGNQSSILRSALRR